MLEFLSTFKGMKTVRGHPSMYAVLAESQGLLLTAAPKLMLGSVIGLALRLRIRKADPEVAMDLETAGAVFGFPEALPVDGGDEDPRSGTDVAVAISTIPRSPYELGKVVYDNGILNKLVDEVGARVMGAGVKLSVEPDVIVEYFSEQLKDNLPTEPETEKAITDFPVVVGSEAIRERMNALMGVQGETYEKNLNGSEDNADEENDGEEAA